MFRDHFKYYKRRKPLPSYESVIDVGNNDAQQVRRMTQVVDAAGHIEVDSINNAGLKSIDCWEIFEFPNIAGLIYIKNPFTISGQRYWMMRCLKDYTKKPNKLNIDEHEILGEDETWWDICTRDGEERERALALIPKLRWVTLGYHHNWNNKRYSEENRTPIPKDLGELSKIISRSLGFDDFTAEAAIINFYRMNSTLAGHTDCSENNLDAPLISISFGQSAIFLIGGFRSEDPAQPIFLHSGDIIVMSGESRLRYHGVPKILNAQDSSCWGHIPNQSRSAEFPADEDDWSKIETLISQIRINLNIRQVLHVGQEQLSY